MGEKNRVVKQYTGLELSLLPLSHFILITLVMWYDCIRGN